MDYILKYKEHFFIQNACNFDSGKNYGIAFQYNNNNHFCHRNFMIWSDKKINYRR